MKKKLGHRLRQARERMHLSQTQAAKKIGIHNSTLGKYELGDREPDIETIKKLADLYEVSPQWLLVGYEIEIDRENTAPKNDAQTTIRLIEKEAEKLGMSVDDPLFQEMLADAFKLIRIARSKDTEQS